MYEINQHLGFEVADALKAIDDLNKKFASFGQRLETNTLQLHAWNTKAETTISILQRMATAASATSSAMASVPASMSGASATQAVTAMQAATAAMTQMGQTGARSIHTVTLSWQTMARVMQTQAIIRGFNMVRNAIEEAYTSYMTFSKSVGEIAAINPERNFAQISDSVRKMSDAFNQPIGRVAEGQYQLLSSQFTTDADRVNILTAANKLAKAGAQDLSDTTLLLVGALNAYGETSDKAALRAGEFFETIKLGRLRAAELGTALGRIQGIAHELGVSIEELNASMVAITIGGVKVTEASTQMRGIMASMLKPSEELKKALKGIGVESGPAAIATFGLQGTLDALWKSIDGNKAAAAKLFPNIRAMAGDFRLAGEGAKKFQEAMTAQANVDRGTLDKPFEQFVSTDAEKLQKELNRLSNFFTAEFGQKIIAQLNSVVQALGGGNGLLGTLQVLTGELPRDIAVIAGLILACKGVEAAAVGASRGFTLLDVSVQGNAASITRYFGSLKGIVGMFAAIEAAKIGGSAIGNWYADRQMAPQQAVQDQATRELDIQKIKTDAAIRISDSQADKQFQILRQYVAKASVEYLRDADNFKERAKDVEKSAQQSFDRVFATRQKLTQELFSIADIASKNASGVPDTTAKLLQDIADRRFKSETASHSGNHYVDYNQKLGWVTDEYVKLQGTAKDDREQRLADAAWTRVQAYKELTVAAAKLRGDSYAISQIAQLDDQLDQRKIEALQQYQKTQEQVAQEAEQRGQQARAHTIELENLRLKIADEYKDTVKDGEGGYTHKDSATYKKDLKDAETDTAKFVALMKQYGNEDFTKNFMGDPRAFEAMKREAERSYAGADLKNIAIAPESLANIHRQLQNSVAKLRVEVPAILRLEGIVGESVLQVGVDKLLTDAAMKYKATNAKGLLATSDEADRARGQSMYAQGREAFTPAFEARSHDDWGNNRKIEEAVGMMDRLAKQTRVTRDELVSLQAALQGVSLTEAFGNSPATAKAMETMMEGLKMIGAHGAEAPAGKDQSTAEAIKGALDSIQQTQEGVHFASGGMGTDTIPAMLSRGEFVMSAASTRKFYSQLAAMNAGGIPNAYSDGGSVTNVGDINVTVTGGKSATQTGRDIALALRRELRRGTSTI